MSARAEGRSSGSSRAPSAGPRVPGAPWPEPPEEPEPASVPPHPDERRAKRAILRLARLLIGTIMLLFAIGLVYRLLTGGR